MSTIGARWEKVYAHALDLAEMKFASDMAKGEAKDPSEMWELIAYVKLQWGCAELVLLPGDHRIYIDVGTGILSAFELICGGDTGGANGRLLLEGVASRPVRQIPGRSRRYGLGTNPRRIAEQAPQVT